MLGIFFGVICVLAMIRVAMGGRFRHHHGLRGRRGARRFILRRLFRRLNTGPGQEKVVLGEIDHLHTALHDLRTELKSTRKDVAAILRDEAFDRTKLEAVFRKQDDLLARLREAVGGSIEKVHGVLDTAQKSQLADWLERGFRRFAY